MIVFDGTARASLLEKVLKERVSAVQKKIHIVSFYFTEDSGSRLYTSLKQQAAARVGIVYTPEECSFSDSLETLLARVAAAAGDPSVTGILIQKPTKKTWLAALPEEKRVGERADFATWWSTLTTALPPEKDVDGLAPATLAAIAAGTWLEQGRVLPATCRAVLVVLEHLMAEYPEKEIDIISIIGVSDLLGTPLAHVLRHAGFSVELLRKRDFDASTAEGTQPLQSDCIVTATGVPGLITAAQILPETVLIDVGEPKPDVDRESVAEKAFFLTPVPGGVGPLTVLCLLMNAVDLGSTPSM